MLAQHTLPTCSYSENNHSGYSSSLLSFLQAGRPYPQGNFQISSISCIQKYPSPRSSGNCDASFCGTEQPCFAKWCMHVFARILTLSNTRAFFALMKLPLSVSSRKTLTSPCAAQPRELHQKHRTRICTSMWQRLLRKAWREPASAQSIGQMFCQTYQ